MFLAHIKVGCNKIIWYETPWTGQPNKPLSAPRSPFPLQKSIIFHKVYEALVKNINCHYIL